MDKNKWKNTHNKIMQYSFLNSFGMGIIKILKCINLSTAFISLALTQRSILSFTIPSQDMSMWNGVGGICFGGIACIIGIYMIKKGTEQNNMTR